MRTDKFAEVMINTKLERIKINYEAYRITLWEAAKEIADVVERGYITSEEGDQQIRKLARMKRRG